MATKGGKTTPPEELGPPLASVAAVVPVAAGAAAGPSVSEGDWVCPDPDCANVNFARRTACNRCGKDKPIDSNKKKCIGVEIGKAAAEKSRGLFSADDWQCSKCGNVNWARRPSCNVCNAPKFKEVEERTGYGGGYNDRGTVEYIEREESDDEYDEFGRKKKKFRAPGSIDDEKDGQPGIDSPINKPENHEEDDEEDEDEDDDDSDEDGDLSKYDLSDWGTEATSTSKTDDDAAKTNKDASPKTVEKEKREASPRSSGSSHSSSSSSSSDKSASNSNSRSSRHTKKSRSRSRSPRGSRTKRSRSRSRSRDRDRDRSKDKDKDRDRNRSRRHRSRSRSKDRRRSRERERGRRSRSRSRSRSRGRDKGHRSSRR